MNLVFNEISFFPYSKNEQILRNFFLGLMKTFEKAKELYGFDHMVFPSNISELKVLEDKTFYQWVYDIPHQGEKNKILSVVKKPFTNEVLEEQVNGLSKYYYINADVGIPETYCNGLATAYIKETLSVSISSMPFWETTKIHFQKIINDDFETEPVFVQNISKEEHFSIEEIKKFIEYLGEVVLVETPIRPEDKTIALREDHEIDKLWAFSRKLVNSKYVVSIINSLPFNSKAINLIREIYSDGKIEIVLYWEDKGIGVIMQTTGRNYRETEAIAKEIKKKFDK